MISKKHHIDRVILDFPSLWGLLLNCRTIRHADEITIYRYEDESLAVRFGFTFVGVLLRVLFQKRPEMKVLDNSMFWSINPEVINKIEQNEKQINSSLLKQLSRILQCSEQDTTKYFKKALIHQVAGKLYISKNSMLADSPDTCLILTDDNIFGIYNTSKKITEDKLLFSVVLRSFTVVLPTLLIFFAQIAKFKLSWLKKTMPQIDIFVQVTHFGYEAGTYDIKKEFVTEDYVFDKARVGLLIVDAWRPRQPEEVEHYKKHLKHRGIHYVDVQDFSLDPFCLKFMVGFLIKSFFYSNRSIKSWNEIRIYTKIVWGYLIESVYAHHLDCKAILSFDDYSDRHIIRTAVCRQKDILSMGIQHSCGGGQLTMPQLAYVFFDVYFVFGNHFKSLFNGFWDDLDLVTLSYNRVDGFLRRRKKINTDSPIADMIMPSGPKKRILITLPSINTIEEFLQMFPNANGMLNFLSSIDRSICELGDFYIRPKYTGGIEDFERLIDNPAIHIIVDDRCTTTELLDQADFVIASNASGVVAECALIKKKVIVYDYLGFLKQNWIKFGSDMCAESTNDLERIITAFLRNDKIDIDWEYLWEDMVYPNDGHTNEIIRTTLNEYLSKVDKRG